MALGDTMDENDPLIGHTLAEKYEVEALVNTEELGKVYRARRVADGVTVHVKVFDPHKTDDELAFERFHREMVALASMEHPNVVKMLDFGDHRTLFHFIVLEDLEGISLEKLLATEKLLPIDAAVRIARQVALALDAAHAQGIVHRNLNPANIVLVAKSDRHVKVSDFGLSQVRGEVKLTRQGVRVGSPIYQAPEYLMRGTVDDRSDLYALGVILFQMITGTPIAEPGGAERPSTKVKGLPTWLDDLVFMLLSADPRGRPPSATDLVARLDAGVQSQPPPAMTPIPKGQPPAEVSNAILIGTAIVGAAAFVIIVLVAAAYMMS
jgi:serine/threonine protein kinase